MGYPDQLRNLTFAQHQALMEMTEEDEDPQKLKAIFNKACGDSHEGAENGAPNGSQLES